MGLQVLNTTETPIPAAADGASLTPNGSAWANSSWVQLVASTSAASLLTTLIARNNDSTDNDWEIDIGTGGAGSETVIATFSAAMFSTTAPPSNMMRLVLRLPVDNIATATRVACRLRKSGTSTSTWNISAGLVSKPISGSVLTTANVLKALPSAGAHTSCAVGGGVNWANGGWAQITASTAAALVVAAISARPDFNTFNYFEVDIGTGGAGSETVITTLRAGGIIGRHFYTALSNPLDNIANGVRVACRCRANATSGGMRVALNYFEKPL